MATYPQMKRRTKGSSRHGSRKRFSYRLDPIEEITTSLELRLAEEEAEEKHDDSRHPGQRSWKSETGYNSDGDHSRKGKRPWSSEGDETPSATPEEAWSLCGLAGELESEGGGGEPGAGEGHPRGIAPISGALWVLNRAARALPSFRSWRASRIQPVAEEDVLPTPKA
uniref:Uncharacterized protein n=1 Tax=Alexandrium monilatum TaxID=311494 RepID=A0A7S4V5Y6_9DINO|mmetsp:Transcript_10138/g.30391  ORF Transcript_10138/g.30391 Transcript_10138/m.30391 type:complete len:168 (+) Transcript_10138:45-548(+)